MAITTYAELQTAIASWLDRTDLDSKIPDFISIAESRIKRQLRFMEMETVASLTTVAGTETVSLPTDYNGMRSLYVDGAIDYVLESLTPQDFREYYASGYQGIPRHYTIYGEYIQLGPIPDAEYTLKAHYYAFAPLSDANPSNAVLTAYPELYLYLSLAAAEGFIVNDARIMTWKAQADEAIAEVRKHSQRKQYGSAPNVVRASW